MVLAGCSNGGEEGVEVGDGTANDIERCEGGVEMLAGLSRIRLTEFHRRNRDIGWPPLPLLLPPSILHVSTGGLS